MINRQNDHYNGHSRLRTGASAGLALLLLVGTVYAASPGGDGARANAPAVAKADEGPLLADLRARVERVNRGWAQLASYYDTNVAPVDRVLQRYRSDEELTSRIAAALVREGHATGLEPRLLLAVLLVENPWLDPTARSSVGAVGLMQVMPVHRGGWSCGYDLEDIDTNVCLGARIFSTYLTRTGGDLEKALLRYNGCVTGSNTPDCHQYPSRVLARAGQAYRLAWAGQGPSAASP